MSSASLARRTGMTTTHILETTDFFGLRHGHVSVLATTAAAEGTGIGRALTITLGALITLAAAALGAVMLAPVMLVPFLIGVALLVAALRLPDSAADVWGRA